MADKLYRVRAEITLLADSESEALENAAIALSSWDLERDETRIQGVGLPEGTVSVSEVV